MRAFSWVPLLGLLAVLAAAQDDALEDLANSKMSVVTPSSPQQPVHEEPPAHKASGSSILDTVQGIMASFSPNGASPPSRSEGNDNQGEEKLVAQPIATAEEEGAATEEETPPLSTTAVDEEPTTSLGSQQEEPSSVSTNNNNNQVKLVRRYNEVTDNVLRLLSRSLSQLEPLPITINDDVALMALEASEPEPEPEPQPEGEGDGSAQSGGKKGKKRNKKNKKKNKNKNRDEESDVEESERNTSKKNKKNKTKVAENEEEEQEGAVEGRPSKNKKRNKKNKNKRKKNKRKNKRKNKGNKKNKSGMENSRDGRDMFEDDDGEDEESPDFSGRRNPAPAKKKNKNRSNTNGKRKNKNRKNKKNKKNRKNQQQGKVESREDHGPVYPSVEERELSNAFITGFTSLSRDGDVMVDTSSNSVQVDVKVQVGPLFVQLADSARALTKSQVSTTLEANMQFRIKNKGRGRQLIKLTDLTMGGPEEVNVARLDLPLEPELVSAAQDEVREALDVPRLGRIFRRQLESIFEEDNVVQNLEHHELLKKE